MIVILGPTATGKTTVAVQTACRINGEIISADSRQVFRGMDIGTGKDLDEYVVDGKKIPYHLIDIADAGEEYSVFRFQQDFLTAWNDIRRREKPAILCGGTGFYIESVLRQYQLAPVPDNPELRERLSGKSLEELAETLSSLKKLHNKTDTKERERLIRAIEIESFYQEHPETVTPFPKIDAKVFGIRFEREIIRERITQRLRQRLDNGMVEEVETLLRQGVPPEKLMFYGLEYRYVTQHLLGEISREELFRLLNIAIHQFAKRQTTWFRKMEQKGIEIQWLDSALTAVEKAEVIVAELFNRKDLHGAKST